MTTIHVMTGLPASGKTTAARQIVADDKGRVRRISLDDLRAMLDTTSSGERAWSHDHEQTALSIQDAAIREAVAGGFDVVVDNTHLTQRIPKRLKAAVLGKATFVVHDFTDVPVDECLRRDAERVSPVGEEVIRKLHASHVRATRNGWRLTGEWMNDTPAVEPYVPDPSLPSAVMCDIDGTLALRGERGPYDFSRCGEDEPNVSVRHALRTFKFASYDRIILLSGRSGDFRAETEAWLSEYNVPYDELWMRAAGDKRRDDFVKAELFDDHVRHRFNVRVSLDDRDWVVSLWRRMGLPTWQVNYGNF